MNELNDVCVERRPLLREYSHLEPFLNFRHISVSKDYILIHAAVEPIICTIPSDVRTKGVAGALRCIYK